MADIKDTAFQAVRESGKIIKRSMGKISDVSFKQKNDYLTNVDIEAENKIKEIISAAFPNHGFVAEESEIPSVKTDYTWFIDPISSTVNFIHGLPHFSTVIALQKADQTIFSCVLDPFYDELFFAEAGKGAFLNGERIKVSSVDKLSNAMVFLGLYMKGERKIEENRKYLESMLSKISDYRRIGSTALQLCYVACGRADAYTHNNSDIFAIPAGKLILEEAGGKLTDFQGNFWTLDSTSIVGTNNFLHAEIISTLQA